MSVMEGATVTLRLTDDFLCPDCARLFDKPKVLSCGHSVCQRCVCQRWASKSSDINEITCPKCKCGTVLPSSGQPEDFPDNFSLISILGILRLTPEVQSIEKHIGGNGNRKLLSPAGKELQRVGPMQRQLEQDYSEIRSITENAKAAVRRLTQSKSHLDKQINDSANTFIERVTNDTMEERNRLLESVEQSFKDKIAEANGTLEKAKVLEATIFSAREVTSSICSAIEREDADLRSNIDLGGKVENLVKDVEKKMVDIRKRKVPDVLGIRFQPHLIECTPAFGHLPDLLLFIGVLWVSNNELALIADRRLEHNSVTLRVVKYDEVTKVLTEFEITPKDKEAPVTSITSQFRAGTILIAVGREVYVLGVERQNPAEASTVVTESVLAVDIPRGTHVTSLSVRHDGKMMIGTNLSNMIHVYSEDGTSLNVIQTLAEDDVLHPISLCSISYYRTAVCCLNAQKVVVLSHSWNAAKTKRTGYLTPARESENGRKERYVCKCVKSSLSGWLVLWLTSEVNNNPTNDDAMFWQVICYDYVSPLQVSLIAKGDSRETGLPSDMDVREKQLVMSFPDGRIDSFEL